MVPYGTRTSTLLILIFVGSLTYFHTGLLRDLFHEQKLLLLPRHQGSDLRSEKSLQQPAQISVRSLQRQLVHCVRRLWEPVWQNMQKTTFLRTVPLIAGEWLTKIGQKLFSY